MNNQYLEKFRTILLDIGFKYYRIKDDIKIYRKKIIPKRWNKTEENYYNIGINIYYDYFLIYGYSYNVDVVDNNIISSDIFIIRNDKQFKIAVSYMMKNFNKDLRKYKIENLILI